MRNGHSSRKIFTLGQYNDKPIRRAYAEEKLSPALFMRFLMTTLTLLGLITCGAHATPLPEIVIQTPRSELDGSYQFYTDLLRLAIAGQYQLTTYQQPMTQNRAFHSLDDGTIDILWAGTNLQREVSYRAIRVPIYGGLLGKRIPAIRARDKARFDAITEPAQLQSLIACQGNQWPDSDILEDNGYKVDRIARFDVMYRMLDAGRCDYFPRAVTEVYSELDEFGEDRLMAYDSLLLSYPFPMYFFTGKDNEELAAFLEKRLTALAHSGELRTFIENHPVTQRAFPLERFRDARIFTLQNKRLPPETPVSDSSLWFSFPESESRTEVE